MEAQDHRNRQATQAKATTVTAPSAPSKAAPSKGAALKETPTKVDPPKTDSKTDPLSADPNKLTCRSEILNPPSLSVKKVVLNKELVSKEEVVKGPKLKAKKDKEVFTPDKTGPYAGLNEAQMREVLLVKQKQYLEMQQKKLEHELLRTKAKLEEQQRQLEKQTGNLHAAGKVQTQLEWGSKVCNGQRNEETDCNVKGRPSVALDSDHRWQT
uniref:Pre-mRNA cleavage complex 2 protein Pcf11 helical domain-containing protein n=1 Tax=Timema tahoe TaxID=61484 RepID=A0A7R9IDV8_9NEOP|nr:unnamed protein product [Timema tahoe]